PLLVELGYADKYDLVVIVDAPEEVRLERLVADRGMTKEAALSRIRSQATTEQRRAVADVWIDNTGTPEELREQASEVWTTHVEP
ncbi:dephospho-CoA kinase, partial [Xanthomonas citri pv. citri]|nr:dephospho-CoA kinase [Xanthomonas citri pv. citri]